MPTSEFYPPLSDIISVDALPEQLSFVKGGLASILDGIFYRNFQFSKSARNDSAFYSLDLVAYKRLAIEIPGTGMSLLINPKHDGDPDIPTSIIHTTLWYEWEILRYVNSFSLDTFSGAAQEFFNILLELGGVTGRDILELVITIFVGGATPITTFVNALNSAHGSSVPVPSGSSPDPYADLELSIFADATLAAAAITPAVIVFADYLDDAVKAFENIETLFETRFNGSAIDMVKRLLVPKASASLDISLGMEFPRTMLIPTSNGTPLDDPATTILLFGNGTLSFSTEGGIGFDGSVSASLNHPSQIAGTGFTIDISGAKLDLSRTDNIPEANLDGRPVDFVGVYIDSVSIGLPKDWTVKQAVNISLVGKGLLIGTGGISGTIGLEVTGANPVFDVQIADGFTIGFTSFDVTFKQNAIVATSIVGQLTVPGFTDANGDPVKIGITVTIGKDGFVITAVPDPPVELRIKNVLSLKVASLSIGEKNGRYFLAVSGTLTFEDMGGTIGQFLPSAIEIKKLVIWQDGAIEFEGGSFVLPRAVTVQIGPVKLSVTAIHLGSHEAMHDGSLRRYRYFGFDGGVSINPGGVDARGDGIKFYFTVDSGPLHVFVRIQSIAIDLVIPGNVSKEDAAVLISGYLSMKDPSGPGQSSGTEYIGGVSFALPRMKMGGSAAMRLNPSQGAFLIDAGLELSTPILLGATGLGIYGFRGLLGQKYVVDKSLALPAGSTRDPDTVDWWEYYKAKVAPDFHEGIQVSKFAQRDGFSLGAGVSVATAGDSGHVFSSKLFLLLSLPEVFLLQGQAAILSQRIGLDNTNDPPFSAFISVDRKSVQAGFGVHYRLPDGGEILKLDAEARLGFFFGDASGWYINLGEDQPPSKRVQARIFTILDAYAYLMISSSGIKAGAGASWELNKKFGPVGVELGAYFDEGGQISFKPVQIGAFIRIGGYARLRVFRFKFGLGLSASLSGEAPRPFVITGSVTVSLNLPWPFPDINVNIELTWRFSDNLNLDEVKVIEMAGGGDPTKMPAKALNIMSQEPFALAAYNTTSQTGYPGGWPSALDAYTIPMDSFIDIEFAKPVQPDTTVPSVQRIGEITGGVDNRESVPPQRAKHDQVTHEYWVNDVEVLYWDHGSWLPYRIFLAETPMRDRAHVDLAVLNNAKIGYFQMTQPSHYTKLRLLAQTPLSYTTQGTGDVVVEDLGFPGGMLFCEEDRRSMRCVDWLQYALNLHIAAGRTSFNKRVLFRVVTKDGVVTTFPNVFRIAQSLSVEQGGSIEIYLSEPVLLTSIKLSTLAAGVTITYYARTKADANAHVTPPPGIWNLGSHPVPPAPNYYTRVSSVTKAPLDLLDPVVYDGGAVTPRVPIDKIVITASGCTDSSTYWQQLAAAINARKATLQTQYNAKEHDAQVARDAYNQANACDAYCHAHCSNCTTNLDQLRRDADRLEAEAQEILDQINKLNQLLSDINNGSGPSQPATKCATFLHEVCWLTEEHYEYNLTIPPESDVDAAARNMVESLTKTIQPIWRPNTYYLVRIGTRDKIVSPSNGPTFTQYYMFGFKTGGPVGHFAQLRPEYQALVTQDRADEYKLATLKHYIDYDRSYPNADGSIVNAKPLYYREPRLLLFYKYAYVFAMFSNWDTYGGLAEEKATLEVVIKDPAEPKVNPKPKRVDSDWAADGNVRMEEDVKTINNLILFGKNCILITGPIRRPGMYSSVPLNESKAEPLEPLKLYSVIMNAVYNSVTSEIHKYVFQTSRYADFKEHIGSYVLDKDTSRQAVYMLGNAVTSGAVPVALDLLNGVNNTAQDDLKKKYQHIFDRLIDGALRVRRYDAQNTSMVLDPAETVEANIVMQGSQRVGLLVRSPEPFNDPKIPEANLLAAVAVRMEPDASPGTELATFRMVLSKDRSQIFITNDTMTLPAATVRITFSYLEFDGSSYVSQGSEEMKFHMA
ncbi:MAG: hypothetical protein JST22_19395 [Bacteroidetes bacterium]|nr:hypothetical protein [Bacteroidota bacterium]